MKNVNYRFTIGLVLIMTLLSCENNNTRVIPSNNVTSQFMDITGYTALVLNTAFEAEIYFSDTELPIEIVANDNLHQYVEIVKTSDELRVELQKNVNISGPAQLKVILSTGYLKAYTANGASVISLMDTLMADDVTINLSGASKMDGAMVVQNLSADLQDASSLDLSGETTYLGLTASGASRVSGFLFSCLNLDADLSGASEVELTVNEKINITASGASILSYKGDGAIESQNLKNASMIVKVD